VPQGKTWHAFGVPYVEETLCTAGIDEVPACIFGALHYFVCIVTITRAL